jgi:hypothetical protein
LHYLNLSRLDIRNPVDRVALMNTGLGLQDRRHGHGLRLHQGARDERAHPAQAQEAAVNAHVFLLGDWPDDVWDAHTHYSLLKKCETVGTFFPTAPPREAQVDARGLLTAQGDGVCFHFTRDRTLALQWFRTLCEGGLPIV